MDTNILKGSVLSLVFLILFNSGFSQYKTTVIVTDIANKALVEKIEWNSTSLLTEFNLAYFGNRKPEIDNNILTSNAIKSILSLWEMSMFRCYETDIIEKGIQRKEDYEIRNIPLFFKEAPEGENYEEAVLVFNSNGLIDDIYISIGTNRVNDILKSSNSVTDFRRRQIVIDFVENFRTAYNRKDAEFLEKVFSENALIITGKIVKVKNSPNDFMQSNLGNEKIEYQRQTKAEYITKLKNIFNINAYINIKFEEIEVVQHGKYPEIYGVTIKQYWNTTRYSDVGYVFLMIDFKDEDNPIIHVRTWQPEKIGEQILAKDDVFSLGSFGEYNRE